MIDLHSHILPGLCDGSQNMETSLEMVRMAVADGTTHLACTPHIYPTVYENSKQTIAPAMAALQAELDERGIPLQLVIGADVHMVPEVMSGLKQGSIPTLNNSRYFLLEPSHHVPVIGFLDHIESFLDAGYVPVITHPERLSWFDGHYNSFIKAAEMGAWLQVTAGAIAGHFGKKVKKSSERLLLDGYVHIIASDAHGTERRPPILSEGLNIAIKILDDKNEAMRTVFDRPRAILYNDDPDKVFLPPALHASGSSNNLQASKVKWIWRLLNKRHVDTENA